MPYSHDRTLLARFGFADPDKKNPRHDLACRYGARSALSGTHGDARVREALALAGEATT